MSTFRERKIYLASSWRNLAQPAILHALRRAGHQCYDFRHPKPGDEGFSWRSIGEGWQSWSIYEYRNALEHPIAQAGFKNDFDAMQWADTGVLLLPCGRSAHLEAGWLMGAGKEVFVALFSQEQFEPELMVLLAGTPRDHICLSLNELFDAVGFREPG